VYTVKKLNHLTQKYAYYSTDSSAQEKLINLGRVKLCRCSRLTNNFNLDSGVLVYKV
jgi:hypothetical protein